MSDVDYGITPREHGHHIVPCRAQVQFVTRKFVTRGKEDAQVRDVLDDLKKTLAVSRLLRAT